MNGDSKKIRLWGLITAVVVVALDQATKIWMMGLLTEPPRLIEIAPFFNLVPVWNTGISFGLFANTVSGAMILTGVALFVVVGLIWWLMRSDRPLIGLALGLAIGGALGNVIDRVQYGAVFDFLDVHVGDWHWPAFNIADSGITVGVVLLLLDGLFPASRSAK